MGLWESAQVNSRQLSMLVQKVLSVSSSAIFFLTFLMLYFARLVWLESITLNLIWELGKNNRMLSSKPAQMPVSGGVQDTSSSAAVARSYVDLPNRVEQLTKKGSETFTWVFFSVHGAVTYICYCSIAGDHVDSWPEVRMLKTVYNNMMCTSSSLASVLLHLQAWYRLSIIL